MFRSKKWIILSLSLISVLSIAGCTGSGGDSASEAGQPAITLTVSGSGGTTLILESIQAAFEADTAGYQLEILSGTGTGGGVQGVSQETLDVAAMARAPKDEEMQTAPDLLYLEFGQSGQAFYTSTTVNVSSLTSAQINAIFQGEISNWAEVGGPDLEIALYVRDEGDSSTQTLREAVLGDSPFSETAKVMTSQGDMIAAVQGVPGAIGFGTWPAVLAAGADVNPIALDGIAPNDAAYPITGALGIGYLAGRQADVQPLVDWLLSEQGLAALQDLGVITSQ